MNITRYISLYLLKNRSCYIEGVGTLVVEHQPAYYDGRLLYAAKQDVALNNNNNSDELAQFIATNEQVSLSKVFSALHGFTAWLKAELDAGREVPIPGIGSFSQNKNNICFIAADAFKTNLPPIAATRSEQVMVADAAATAVPVKRRSSSGWAVFTVIIAAIAILGGAYLYQAYIEMQLLSEFSRPAMPATAPKEATTPPADTVSKDTATIDHISTTMPAVTEPKARIYRYNVVLTSYYNLDKAQTNLDAIKTRGNQAHLETRDSFKYMIVMTVRTTNRDTSRVLDSLAALFNPKGVYLR